MRMAAGTSVTTGSRAGYTAWWAVSARNGSVGVFRHAPAFGHKHFREVSSRYIHVDGHRAPGRFRLALANGIKDGNMQGQRRPRASAGKNDSAGPHVEQRPNGVMHADEYLVRGALSNRRVKLDISLDVAVEIISAISHVRQDPCEPVQLSFGTPLGGQAGQRDLEMRTCFDQI
jgi:hypothetical protein